MAWTVVTLVITNLIISFASLALIFRLASSIRDEIEKARLAPEFTELSEQVAGLRRGVDRLNDTIYEELLHQQESLGTITQDD